jgi:hypothetical protein
MMSRALIQRWPLDAEKKAAIMDALYRVVTSGAASPREITSAAKALMSAEQQNQSDEHKVVDIANSTAHDRISEIARDLGIDATLIVDATSKAD